MNRVKLKEAIENLILEDVGSGDITAESIFDEPSNDKGIFKAKSDGVICGLIVAAYVYEALGGGVQLNYLKKDGDLVTAGTNLLEVEGPVKTLFTGERLILNLMQRMSGIATMTFKAVEVLESSSIRVCDTRKTMPGLRLFEKYAVRMGGGYNHRIGLYDGVMLKDNHIAFAGSISEAVRRVKEVVGLMMKIEVEIESKEQLEEAIKAGVDIIMIDNCSPEKTKSLAGCVPNSIITEASGGITLETLGLYSHCGVDYISLGCLTHSTQPFDISFNSVGGSKI